MIEEFTLRGLLEKYKINADKIISRNDNVLSYGEYQDIDKTLDYLVNELKIDRTNIEKSPSILYRNVSDIKNNVIFLKKQKIKFSNVETCLHVLSTDHDQLKETYDYVWKNYGIDVINNITSILSTPKDKIIGIEKLNIPFKNRNDIISVSVGSNSVEDIKEIVDSEEFKTYPHLFTSEVLSHAKLSEIVEIIHSKEFETYPHLFTSQVLAHAKLKDIKSLLELPYWEDERFKKLLTSSIVAKSKSMLIKLPILFEMAEKYSIDNYLNTSFLLLSPNQNYALINYLIDNDIPLIIDYKLNSIFGKQPGLLKKKYNIDLKVLMEKYPMPKYESIK